VVDAHLDLAAEVRLRRRTGEEHVIRNRYLQPFREGGFNLIVSSVFVDTQALPHGLSEALGQVSALLRELDELQDEMLLVRTRSDLDAALAGERIGVLLCMEGLDPLGAEPELLWALHAMGVRGAALTWSRSSPLAEGCCRATELRDIRGGITPLGFEALALLERLRMFVDVSHLNDDGFAELAARAEGPFIATHSNARSVQMNYRNLTDEQIRTLAAHGGVMGLNAYTSIVGADPRTEDPIPKLCDHIEHVIGLVGDAHVGFGFDLCDSYYAAAHGDPAVTQPEDCLKSHADAPEITAELLRRGHSEARLQRIVGGNFVEFFRRAL
jgi:membrane dipeptidase